MTIRAFVSSTYGDLKDHRAYVIERLVRDGILVDPMEKWNAASDEPKELSQERVRDCDLCILLVGFRRGHVPEGETSSITQMEFREACRREIDILVFLAAEEANWPAEDIAAFHADPEMARWREELKEHYVVGSFTPQPQSLDLDSAVFRWFEKRAGEHRKTGASFTEGKGFPIEIRAHSNSEAVLVVWRTEQPIKGCLGFALHRKVLKSSGVSEDVITSLIGFPRDEAVSESAALSPRRPIQRFRWIALGDQEARFRVVPVLGNPTALRESADGRDGSAWTPWVAPRVGQSPGYRAFFNNSPRALRERAKWPRESLKTLDRSAQSAKRELLGGELRRTLLGLITKAKLLDQRVHIALSDLDDAEIIEALKVLGKNLYLLVSSPTRKGISTRSRSTTGVERALRVLRSASVHVYESGKARSARSNFAVFCDRWGAPNQVWTGSAAWTIKALCLNSNNAILIDSVALGRAYLDRWEDLRDGGVKSVRIQRTYRRPAQISRDATSITVWNTPTEDEAELKDARRIIQGAREGVLFIMGGGRSQPLLNEILRLRGKDLFIQGIASSTRGNQFTADLYNIRDRQKSLAQLTIPFDSTIVLVDPFGPHPVVMTGSHDLSSEVSAAAAADLLIVENAPGLAAEYAVHLIRWYDHYRFRMVFASSRVPPHALWLKPTDAWQGHYFEGSAQSEFNFLFGALSPGL